MLEIKFNGRSKAQDIKMYEMIIFFPTSLNLLLFIAHLREKNLIWRVSSSSGPKQQSSLLPKPSSLSWSAAPEHKRNKGTLEQKKRVRNLSLNTKESEYLGEQCAVVLQWVVDHLLCCVQMGQQLPKLHGWEKHKGTSSHKQAITSHTSNLTRAKCVEFSGRVSF